MSSELSRLLADRGIALEGGAQQRLVQYMEMVVRASEVQNLTALRSPAAFLREGILDSILAWRALGRLPGRVVDVGSGGGLPAVVWCIAGYAPEGVLVEAERRKGEFLRLAAAELGLSLEVRWARAEDEARGALRDAADLVTARAVASAPVAVEVCGGLVRTGGTLCLLKGTPQRAEAEARMAAPVARRMGFAAVELRRYELDGDIERTLLVYRKERPTPTDRPTTFARLRREFPSRERDAEREAVPKGE